MPRRLHPERPLPPPTGPGAYLEDAADALTDCGSAPVLYADFRDTPNPVAAKWFSYERIGPSMQQRRARTCILLSAFAAEAYVNLFLPGKLSAADLEAVDRLATADKYAVGVKLATGEDLFPRGTEPLGSLVALFKLRDRLVHPKSSRPIKPADVTPGRAAELLVATAVAGYKLSSTDGVPDLYSGYFIQSRERIIALGQKWTGQVPGFDDPSPKSFTREAIEQYAEGKL